MDDVLTTEQIATVLQAETERIERAEQPLTEHRQSWESLFTRCGYDACATAAAVRGEQAERLADVERSIATIATAAAQYARDILRQVARFARPVPSGEDLTRAALLRAEIREDVERLDAPALRDRLVAVVTTNDRPRCTTSFAPCRCGRS